MCICVYVCVRVCVRGRTSASSIWVRPTSWITWSCHRCFCLPSGYLMKFLTSHTECNATGLTEERRYIVCCIFAIERLWGLSLRTPSLPGTIFMRVDRRWEENEMAHFLATSIICICCIFLFYPLPSGASQLLDTCAQQPMISIDNGDGYEWSTHCLRRFSGLTCWLCLSLLRHLSCFLWIPA